MKAIRTLTIGVMLLGAMLTASAQNEVMLQKYGCSDAVLQSPELQQDIMASISLYQENVKQFRASKDQRYLQEAYPFWKKVVENCPQQSRNLYINGANILKVKIANAQNAEQREGYIAELMQMYDIRIAAYGDAAKYTATKAMELEEIKGAVGLQDYYKLYSDAVNMGEDLEAGYLVKYMEATINYVRAGYADPTLVVDNYDIASDMLEAELRKNVADSVKAATIRSYIAGVEAAFSPYASCEQLTEIYGKKFNAEPENVELLKKITNIMMRKGCTEDPLFFNATENLYRLEPTPLTAMRMGTMCMAKKDYSKAVEYLGEAVKGVEEKDQYNAYLYLGHAYSGMHSYSAARSAYNNAASVDGSKGEPYRMIAQLYASSSSSAGEDNVGGRSVYWAAVDKLYKSKSVDPTEANVEICNRLIGQYSAHFPKNADAFMAGLQEGKSFRVPGWIGESTIIRTR